MRHLGLGILGLLSLAVLWTTAGCTASGNVEFTTEARLDQGLVIILPGIEGESHMNHDIRRGLVAAGIYRALPIHLWGRPIPGVGMLLNQMDVIGNRLAGGQIAKMITAYQDSHPGRPVYLVGHSGGGGVAVFSAEALPPGRKVDGLVLLSASISKGYDLTKALGKCRNGIVNFYSEADVGFLVIGTIVAGNVDGVHGPAAGAVGFDWPTDAKQRAAYSKLYQVSMNEAMTGGGDPHAASTGVGFVSRYVAPWVSASSWPAGRAENFAAGQTSLRPAKALALYKK